jgi:hypothetical protein
MYSDDKHCLVQWWQATILHALTHLFKTMYWPIFNLTKPKNLAILNSLVHCQSRSKTMPCENSAWPLLKMVMPECPKFAGTEVNRHSGETWTLNVYLQRDFTQLFQTHAQVYHHHIRLRSTTIKRKWQSKQNGLWQYLVISTVKISKCKVVPGNKGT